MNDCWFDLHTCSTYFQQALYLTTVLHLRFRFTDIVPTKLNDNDFDVAVAGEQLWSHGLRRGQWYIHDRIFGNLYIL